MCQHHVGCINLPLLATPNYEIGQPGFQTPVEGVTAKVWALVMRISQQMDYCRETNSYVLESLQTT